MTTEIVKPSPETAASGAEATASTADADGFVVESHSAPAEAAVEDTTAAAEAKGGEKPAQADKEPAKGAGDKPPATAVGKGSDTDDQPASGKDKKGSLAVRQKSLTKEIDTLTYAKHQTDRELREAQTRLAAARGELAQIEAKIKKSATGEDGKPAAVATNVARPAVPKYRDFATDDEYDAAVEKWRADDEAWLLKRDEARDKALETRVVESVEQRLARERAEAVAGEEDRALVARLTAAREAHPDWSEKAEALGELRSAWWDPVKHAKVSPTPFLSDVALSTEDGPEILYRLGALMETEPERAQKLADLLPTKQLRDAIVISSSPLALLEYFSTDDGEKVFEQLKEMHPSWLGQAIGALSARLEAAPGGPASGVLHPITKASPSAKPPAGAPRTREQTTGSGASPGNFADWMAAEDAKERAAKLKAAGIAATA